MKDSVDVKKKSERTIEAYVCVALFVIMLVALNFQIVSRLFPSVYNTWTDESTRYLSIWLIYVGAGLAAIRKEHIIIDVMGYIWPKKLRKYTNFLGEIALIVFCIYIMCMTFGYAMGLKEDGAISGALLIPLHWAYLAVPVGYLFLIIRFLQINFVPTFRLMLGASNNRLDKEVK